MILSTRTEIQELAKVPLILGFLLQEYIESKSFSKDKLDLYKNIVTRLNNKIDEVRGIKRNFKIENPIFRYEIITNLAFSGLFNFNEDNILNRLVFTYDQILNEAKKYCSDKTQLKLNPYDLVEDIKSTALLREIGNDTYAFTHLTIQEYLAATVLVKDKNKLAKLFSQAYFDPVICEMEVLPMIIGLSQSYNSNTNINLYELLEKLPESLNFANLRLRARGLGYLSKKIDDKHLSLVTNRLIEFVTEKNNDEWVYRKLILQAFVGSTEENRKYISRQLLNFFQKFFQKSKEDVYTRSIISTLGQLQAKEAIPELIDILKVINELFALYYYNTPSLLKVYEYTISNLINALVDLQAKEAIPELIKILKDKRANVLVGNSAAKALVDLQAKEAIPELIDILKVINEFDSKDYRLKKQLNASSLAVSVLVELQAKEAIPELIKILKDEDNRFQYRLCFNIEGLQYHILAVSSLGQLQVKEAIPELIKILKDEEEHSGVRNEAAKALVELQAKEAIPELIKILKDEDKDRNFGVISEAISALGQLQAKEAIPELIKILKDKIYQYEHEEFLSLARALVDLQAKEAIPELIKILKDEDKKMRPYTYPIIVFALRKLQAKEAIPELIKILKDEEENSIHMAASYALVELQAKEAIPELIKILKDEEETSGGT